MPWLCRYVSHFLARNRTPSPINSMNSTAMARNPCTSLCTTPMSTGLREVLCNLSQSCNEKGLKSFTFSGYCYLFSHNWVSWFLMSLYLYFFNEVIPVIRVTTWAKAVGYVFGISLISEGCELTSMTAGEILALVLLGVAPGPAAAPQVAPLL